MRTAKTKTHRGDKANYLIYQLAHLYGVQTAYYDVTHHRQQASVQALLAVLRALGAPVETIRDIPPAWRERRQALWQQPLEPVAVAWDGRLPLMQVQFPYDTAEAPLVGHLSLETGERQSWEWHGADLPVVGTAEVEGIQYVVKQFSLPGELPWGYHHFTLEMPGRSVETLIIAAPLTAYIPPEGVESRMWGVFLPLYALYTQKSWGSGDFSDMEALIKWTSRMGGNVVASLPFLATFLDEPFEPSPYTPASRLLWNEFYLDITRIPELGKCPSAQALLASLSFQKEIQALRDSSLVDYRRQMALKHQVLKELCRCCFADASGRLEALRHFTETHPRVEDYARFRATCEKQGASWRSWPQPLQEGILKEGDYNEEVKRYHLYVQWLAHQQVKALSDTAREKGLRLYFDLPLGVHPDGYDVWRERTAFTLDISAGAPPDAVFTKGQNWEFPPLQPEKIREQGYKYTIACLRHHLQHAGIFRIDHVMGLHRLYWIPKGLEASQGVYVRYHAEELYAILTLESHRNKVIIVGEDLGTVPPEVRPAMARHSIHRMYVVQYELVSVPRRALRRVPRNSLACLETHDMFPFTTFWQGRDIEKRRKLGLLDGISAQLEQKKRLAIREAVTTFLQDKDWIEKTTPDVWAVIKACLAFLSASQARIVIAHLEDLWLETQPQNVPGTRDEHPNWQRKTRYSFEDFCQIPQITDTLKEIDRLRKQREYKR